MRKTAFAPIVSATSKVILLGTMPSEESIRKQEYYGHKSNQFWKLLFTLFNKPLSPDYKERVALLIQNDIALWDVLSSCEGVGSLDSNIEKEEANDFDTFFEEHPLIEQIFFTSQKAFQFYKKYVGFGHKINYTILPSPSPANAKMNFETKLAEWTVILDYIKKN